VCVEVAVIARWLAAGRRIRHRHAARPVDAVKVTFVNLLYCGLITVPAAALGSASARGVRPRDGVDSRARAAAR
jgi:hypothetical protein